MDHSTNTLTAAIKSLTDGVGPALDRTDPLALQQLTLVTDYLGFLRERLPYLHARALFELRAAQDLAAAVRPHVSAVDVDAGRELEEVLAASEAVNDGAASTDVEDATANILAVLREIVRTAAGAPAEVRRAVEKAVLDDSERTSAFYRSWYLPLGFDPYPGEVRSLPDVIAGG